MSTPNPLDIQALQEQAESAWKQAQYAEAEQKYQQVLAIRERERGSEHPDLAPILNALGALAQTTEQYPLAEAYYRRALAIREHELGPEHPDTIESIGNLAGIRDDQGDRVLAEQLYTQALTLSDQALVLTLLLLPWHLASWQDFIGLQANTNRQSSTFTSLLLLLWRSRLPVPSPRSPLPSPPVPNPQSPLSSPAPRLKKPAAISSAAVSSAK